MPQLVIIANTISNVFSRCFQSKYDTKFQKKFYRDASTNGKFGGICIFMPREEL